MILSNEEDAQAWLRTTFDHVPRETWIALDHYLVFLGEEGMRQNLLSRSSFDHLYLRHVADSAQLLRFTPQGDEWLDLGSGAGFPGLITGLLSQHLVTLVESRRLRADFLSRAVDMLGLTDRVTILGAQLEKLAPRPFGVISARAFAPLPRLLQLAYPFSTEKTQWILPKGRSAQSELESAKSSWQGDFRLEQSLTDPQAKIIVATGVRPRVQRKSS